MSIPLRWAPGDRCALRHGNDVHVGVVERICKHGFVVVRLPNGNVTSACLADLDLVPLAIEKTQ